jgi:hypothetical protein
VTCDLIIRSYWKDLPWLQLCLRSITRYCSGFRHVIVVLPHGSEARLRRAPPLDPRVRVQLCADYPDDYLGQQVTKLSVHHFTDADFICHVDSDCVFRQLTTPGDLIAGHRPTIVMRPFAELGRHWPWRGPTEAFLGWSVSHDFMQQPPFVYPRWLYPALHEFCLHRHKVSLERYVLSRPPRAFSEFNALGAFAYARFRDSFRWIDAAVTDPGPGRCQWYWSWGGLDARTRCEIEAILSGSAVA